MMQLVNMVWVMEVLLMVTVQVVLMVVPLGGRGGWRGWQLVARVDYGVLQGEEDVGHVLPARSPGRRVLATAP